MELALKPGMRAALPRAGQSAATPRHLRRRSPRRRVAKPGASGSPHAPTATNAVTGKTAMGPWSDAASPTDGLLPRTILCEADGHLHLDPNPRMDRQLSIELMDAQAASGMLSAVSPAEAAAAEKAALEMTGLRRSALRAEQAHALFSHAALDKAPAAKAMLRRTGHRLNQPRRFN